MARQSREVRMISLVRFFFGRDAFISYARSDARTYAPALREALGRRRVSAYLDQDLAPPDKKRPPSLDLQLRRARVFVLVITEATAASRDIAEEVRIACEDPGRVVVPIDVGNAAATFPFDRAPWSRIVGAAREPEDRDALTTGKVSDAVVNRIRASTGAMRQEARLRLAIALAIALIVVAALIAVEAARRAISNALASQALSAQVPIDYALSLAVRACAATAPEQPQFPARSAILSLLIKYERLTRVMRARPVVMTAISPANDVSALALTSDARRMVWGQDNGYLAFADAATGAMIGRGKHSGRVLSIAISPDGRLAATGSMNGELFLWDLQRATRLAVLRDDTHFTAVTAVRFTPDGALAWIDDRDLISAVAVQPSGKLTPLPPLPLVHPSVVFAVSPHGSRIAAGGENGEVDVYDWRSRKPLPLHTPKHDATVWRVAFASEDVLASSGNNVRVTNLATGREVYNTTAGNDLTDLAFDARGRLAIAQKRITVVEGSRVVASIDYPADPIALAFAPDGRLLAGNRDGSVVWWALPDAHGDTTTPLTKIVAVAREKRNGVLVPYLHAFTGDGARLAWIEPRGGSRGTLRVHAGGGKDVARVAHPVRNAVSVLDALTGRALAVVNAPPPWNVTDAAVTPDGRTLAMLWSGRGEEQQLVVRDLRDARDVIVQALGGAQQRRIAISADGRTVALGSFAESVEVWDVPRSRTDFVIPLSGPATAVSVAPDGETIAACDMSTVTIVDRASGLPLAQLPQYADDLVFSPNGETLVMSGFDSIRLLPMSPYAWRKAAERISAGER